MNKTLADLLRLVILVNLIILAFQTLPESKPAQPTAAVTKRLQATPPTLVSDAEKVPSPQTVTNYYLRTSARQPEWNQR